MRSRDLFVVLVRLLGIYFLVFACVEATSLLWAARGPLPVLPTVGLVGAVALFAGWLLLGAPALTQRLRWPDEAEAPADAAPAPSPNGSRVGERMLAWWFALQGVGYFASIAPALISDPLAWGLLSGGSATTAAVYLAAAFLLWSRTRPARGGVA
ncbi:MAG: hypothetical protein JNM10_14700 [Planctomycetia bacterium]|nr:hypothetical protein [Planctomycetia bacterium]